MKTKRIQLPFDQKTAVKLKAGDMVLLSGVIYTARDAAHKKMVELLKAGRRLPFEMKNAVIYYAGPAPARPGQVVGSIGPTTSSRMDRYAPLLIKAGLKGMIGKGQRSDEVRKCMRKNKAVYFAAAGGAGALLSKKVKGCSPVAFHELGPEAVYRLDVEDFPAIVVNDVQGRDFYER